MFGLSSPVARDDAPATSHDTGIAITFFAVLAALTLTLVGGARIFVTSGCSLDNRLALLHDGGEANAISRRGAPCLVSPLKGDWRVKALEVVTPPRNGRVAMRGAIGLLYIPNSQFRGSDSFAFRVIRRDDAGHSATNILMNVNVE
jgi:hypothetical protein